MTTRKFLISMALWSLLPLLAISDIGGIVGFIMIWAVIILVAVPYGLLVQIVGADSFWAKAIPIVIGGMIALFVFYATLRQFVAAYLAHRRGEADLARRKFTHGYAWIACLSVPLLCLDSLARQWP